MGHFFYPHPIPVTETQKHSAYPGCYALSKVLEEVMLEQYYIQYDLNGCCLRAPWIMEKDDFNYQLSFGEDVFGGPRWRDLVGPEQGRRVRQDRRRPRDAGSGRRPAEAQLRPRRRPRAPRSCAPSITPKARQQTFNVCMDEPVDYGELGAYLAESRGLPAVPIRTPYRSTWLDNAKAKFLLGWRPVYDLEEDDRRRVLVRAGGERSARHLVPGMTRADAGLGGAGDAGAASVAAGAG